MAFTGRLGTDDSQLGNIQLGADGSGGTTTVSGTFTADSVLLKTVSATFVADSVLRAPGTGTFTADAVLLKTASITFTADSVTKATTSATFTADSTLAAAGYVIVDNIADAVDCFPATMGASVTAEALDASAFTVEADDPDELTTWTANADKAFTGWIKLIVPSTANVRIDTQGSEMLDTLLFLYDEVPTAASVAIAINDDNGAGGGWSKIITTLAPDTYYVLVAPFSDNGWNYGVEGTQVQINIFWNNPTFTADAVLLKVNSGSFTADAVIKKTNTGTFTADAVLKTTVSGSLTADSLLLSVLSSTFTADATLAAAAGTTNVAFTADAILVGAPIFTDDFNRTDLGAVVASDGSYYEYKGGSFLTDKPIMANGLVGTVPANDTAKYNVTHPMYSGGGQVDFYVPPHSSWEGWFEFDYAQPDVNNGDPYVYISHNSATSPEWYFWVSNDTSTDINADLDHSTWYTFKWEIPVGAGKTARLKWWRTADAEPGTWQISAPAQTSTSGNYHTNLFVGAGDTQQARVDNLIIWSYDSNIRHISGFSGDAVLKKTVAGSGAPVYVDVGGGQGISASPLQAIPAPYSVGDLCLMSFCIDTQGNNSMVATGTNGWTLLKRSMLSNGDQALFTFSKYPTVPYTFAFEDVAIISGGVTGGDTVFGGISASGVANISSVVDNLNTTYTSSSVTGTINAPADSLLVAVFGGATTGGGAVSWFPPSGMTERLDFRQGNWSTFEVNTQALSAPFSGTKTAIPNINQPTLNQIFYLEGAALTQFTADALLLKVNEVAFTADAYLTVATVHDVTFTSDAVLLKTVNHTFTADALIVNRQTGSFTANAVIKSSGTSVTEFQFYANATLVKPGGTGGNILYAGTKQVRKIITLTVADQRRPIEQIIVAHQKPDLPEPLAPVTPPAPCEPPCPGLTGGVGGLYGANGGATRKTVMYCAAGPGFTFTPTNIMGHGQSSSTIPVTSDACYGGSHTEDSHYYKMWVAYPTIPKNVLQMRAKLMWLNEIGIPGYVSIRVFANVDMPSESEGVCTPYSLTYWNETWNSGTHIGDMNFVTTGNGIDDGDNVQFDDTAATLILDGNTLVTNVFRFEINNLDLFGYRARFRSAAHPIVQPNF